jgi:hypothetical protein
VNGKAYPEGKMRLLLGRRWFFTFIDFLQIVLHLVEGKGT